MFLAEPSDQTLAVEAAKVIRGLSGGVGSTEELTDARRELAVREALDQVADRLADSPTARKAFQFLAQTRRPIAKSRVSQMTASVRSPRPSLKYCLRREDR